jgi:phosphopantetheinyl transferase
VRQSFLLEVLASELSSDPSSVRLVRSCLRCADPSHGKPRLAGAGSGQPPLYFNASSTGAAAAVAVSRRAEVGVDVTAIGDPSLADAVETVASAPERSDLRERRGVDLRERMARLWTRKEAVAKAAGTGLVDDLRSLDVSEEVVDFAGSAWRVGSWVLDGTMSLSLAVEHVPGALRPATTFVGWGDSYGEKRHPSSVTPSGPHVRHVLVADWCADRRDSTVPSPYPPPRRRHVAGGEDFTSTPTGERGA